MKSDNDVNTAADNQNENDASIETLLREVGGRDEPAHDVMQAVRTAVHAEWRSVVAERSRRKYIAPISIAASVVVTIGAALLLTKFMASDSQQPQPVLVATIESIHSEIQGSLAQVSIDAGKSWHDAVSGEPIDIGTLLRTDAATKMTIGINKDLSLRVDAGSQFKFTAVDSVTLVRGRLYVDATPQHHVPLTMQTRLGSVEHLGTQYQAQLVDAKLIISVREGRIAYSNGAALSGARPVEAVAGERVEFGEQGELGRHAITTSDASWQWATQVAPEFKIDNQSLAKFVEWVARETGQSIRYASPAVRVAAEQLILRGSIGALTPDQALNAVLATTSFVRVDTANGIEIKK